MELMKLRIFQRQVRDQCQAVVLAADQLDEASASGDNDRLWVACQNLLTGAANVSKVLWGSGGRKAEERRPVRESLAVMDDSPIRSPDLRNHLEHLDERVDTWWESSPTHTLVDRNIGPRTMFSGVAPDEEMFRLYDPSLDEVVFWGTRYQIGPVTEEAARIFPLADAESSKPHWDVP